MVKSVYVPQAGGIIDFPDEATPQQMLAYIDGTYGSPVAPPAPTQNEPDDSGIVARFAYGFGSGLTDIPGGIAALLYPSLEASETAGGRFSESARGYLEETLGIDPTKETTTSQMLAQGVGSLGSFLVPATGVAKVAGALGRGAKLAQGLATATAAGQGVAVSAEQRAERIRDQLASGMQISEEDQLASQRLSGLIGASEALPLGRFFGPLTTLLSKVPVSKAPLVERIVKNRLSRIASAGAAEGAQEAASGIANDLMEYGVYNPDVELGQDLLSNAGTGAFAGSLLEGVIQLAAGRKLRAARQLQQDLASEGRTTVQQLRTAETAQAAEDLRQYNVEGEVDIVPDASDGYTAFRLKSASGNMFGTFGTPQEAEAAVEIYRQRTGAKVKVNQPKIEAEPEEATEESVNTPAAPAATISKPAAVTPTAPEAVTPEAPPSEDMSPEPIIPLEPIPEEMPIGAVELPVEEQRFIEPEAIATPAPIEAPEAPRMEMRPSATTEQLADLQQELFGKPIGVRNMTPEQLDQYNAERDKRYPPVETPVYYDARIAETRPRTISEVMAKPEALRPLTPQADAAQKRMFTELDARLKSIVPEDVGLNIKTMIEEPGYLIRGRERAPEGDLGHFVELASGYINPNLSVDEMIREMVGVLNHEAIHVLRTKGLFRPSEWRILSKAAESTKVPGKKYTYLDKAQAIYEPMGGAYSDPDAVIEEAVAEMYKDWVNGKNAAELGKSGAGKNSRGLFNRLTEFLRKLFRVLSSDAHKNVFKRIEAGELKARTPDPAGRAGSRLSASSEAVEDQRFSAAPALDSDDFKQWFDGSHGTTSGIPDGSPPRVFYHGTSKDQIFYKFKSGMRGIWFTENPEEASMYATDNDSQGPVYERGRFVEKNTASRVIPVYLSYKTPYTLNTGELERLARAPNYSAAQRIMFNSIRAKNPQVDAIIFPGSAKGTDTVVVFEPVQVKSIFNQFKKGTAKSGRFSAAPAIDSDEFKRWFKSSKIVDANNKPLVLYHGTSDVFDEFKQDTGGKKDSGWLGRGFYFTNNTGVANAYAMIKPGVSENIIPVYVSMQNPYYATPAEKTRLKELALSGNEDAAQEFTDRLKSEGHDGVVLDYNSADGAKEYVIFDAVQAKSIFNRFEPGAAESKRFSAAPLPAYIQTQNETLFAPEPNEGFFATMTRRFFDPPPEAISTTTQAYGAVDISKADMKRLRRRAGLVDKNAFIEYLEKLANQKTTGNFQRMMADFSATAALAMRNRSSHISASMFQRGKLVLDYARPGDIQSATMKVEDDPDSMAEIIKILMEPGPVDSVTGEQKDKREVFKSYATAMRARNKAAAGIRTPGEVDQNYINTVIPFTQQNYPEVIRAYEMYQRFNRNLLKTARDSGLLDDTAFQRLTRDMDYYSFYREVFDTTAAPGMPTKTASKFELRPMKGGTHGNLVGDPVYVMTHNAMFWVDAIAKNLAAQKSFKLARDMGVARILGATEKPDQGRGEEEQVMFFRENGVQKRFAVSDPLLVTALGSDDRADMGAMLRLAAMPTTAIRELITRDPGFIFANLARDTLSAWITSGANILPFIGTAKGFAKALKKSSSYQALMGRGVVGSYDLAMRGPQDVAQELRRRATPSNVLTLNGPEAATAVIRGLWNRLGAVSEYSDAATRIAVYEAAKAEGLSDAEATYRAIEIMDFNRRGASQMLSVLTKLVPFLNARIQGMDVLYQAGKAGYRVATGQARGEGETNLGKKFLARGLILAVISLALEMANDGDEDYEQLDEYIKQSNILIPLRFFGLKGQFIAIPNPFETGLIFSTLPRQLYKSWTGDASTRDNAKLFVLSISSTLGVNPIPQFMLPAVEIITNHDFYTGLPLIPEGKARLSPELQYNARTSQLAMMIGKLPIAYDFNSGKFEGLSPIIIDQLIGGYGGPLGTYIAEGIGLAMESQNIGPERLPRDITQLPVVRRFFMDAQVKNPKVVTQAYELFRIVDEANRSFSRLRQTGDAEAVVDYLDKNRDVLSYKRYVFKLVDRLNKLSAYERQIERDTTMTDAEKKEAMAKLRETRIRIASKVSEINEKLGR